MCGVWMTSGQLDLLHRQVMDVRRAFRTGHVLVVAPGPAFPQPTFRASSTFQLNNQLPFCSASRPTTISSPSTRICTFAPCLFQSPAIEGQSQRQDSNYIGVICMHTSTPALDPASAVRDQNRRTGLHVVS